MDPKRHVFLVAPLAALAAAGLTGCANRNAGMPPEAPREGYVLATNEDVPPPPAAPDLGGLNLPPPAPLAAPAPASNFSPQAGQRVHVVASGQTLWKICGIYYGKSTREGVDRILRANPAVANANVIYVGQKLVIPE